MNFSIAAEGKGEGILGWRTKRRTERLWGGLKRTNFIELIRQRFGNQFQTNVQNPPSYVSLVSVIMGVGGWCDKGKDSE